MSDPTIGLEDAAARLAAAGTLLIVGHDRPDGDSLGSMVALARAARSSGRRTDMVCQDPLPRRYAFLLAGEDVLDAARFDARADACDLTVVLDTCAWRQLEGVTPTLRRLAGRLLVIDHHQTRDEMGAACWVDQRAAAVGVMVTELLARLGWPVDGPAAEAAMTAICSDTGWLRFSNTDSRALAAVSRWVEAGVQPDALYRALYESDRPERIALLGRVLSGLELHCQGRLAVMSVTREDFQRSGASPDETENLINEAMRIGQVEVAAMLVENGQAIRVSLRSKSRRGRDPLTREVNVANVAGLFGGGGHARAAGFRAPLPLREVLTQLVAACTKALTQD